VNGWDSYLKTPPKPKPLHTSLSQHSERRTLSAVSESHTLRKAEVT